MRKTAASSHGSSPPLLKAMAKAMRKPKAMARAMRRASAMAMRGRPRKTPLALPALEDAPKPLTANKKSPGKKGRAALATTKPPVKKPWGARLKPPTVPLEVTSKSKKRKAGSAASSTEADPSSPSNSVGTWVIPPLQTAYGHSVAARLPKQAGTLMKGD